MLARNSALNTVGQLLPIIVALVTIPPLIRGLGADRFGILALGWATVGYFGLFEFGLGRALTQAVALRLGKGGAAQDELSSVAWAAILLLTALGVAGAIALALATPLLMQRVLSVPPDLQGEAIAAFRLLAMSLPFVLTSVGLRGLMEAHQDFGVATALRVPLSAFSYLGPLLVLPFAADLVAVAITIVAVRVLGLVAHLVYCLRSYHYLRARIGFVLHHARELMRFGVWLTVTNVVSPMMVYLDRFVIGAVLPMAAVAHYVTPYEAVSKLMLIAGSLLGAMLPAFAGTHDPARRGMLYDWSMRGVMVTTFPFAVVGVVLGPELLRLWTGSLLPPESGTILQWLALGVFINGFAQPPFTMLQAAGRPDLIARLHLAELPFYAVGLWWLVDGFGVVGVAVAWTLRVTVDAVALQLIGKRWLQLALTPTKGAWLLPLTLAALVVGMTIDRTGDRLAYAGVLLALLAVGAWQVLLDGSERARVLQWLGLAKAL